MSRYISLVSIVFSLVFYSVVKVYNGGTLRVAFDPGHAAQAAAGVIAPGAGCYVNRLRGGDALEFRKK